MYSNIVPGAATGVILTAATAGTKWQWIVLFGFCATFAAIGAIGAAKRSLPVFARNRRLKKQEKLLAARLEQR